MNKKEQLVVGKVEDLSIDDILVGNIGNEIPNKEDNISKVAYLIAKRLRENKALSAHDIDGFIYTIEAIKEILEDI